MNNNYKILTVCQRGNCRSVSAAYILKDGKGYKDVIACGAETTSLETKRMLCQWADVILICADQNVMYMMPQDYLYKTTLIDIGGDRWGNPMHPELLEILGKQLQEIGL